MPGPRVHIPPDPGCWRRGHEDRGAAGRAKDWAPLRGRAAGVSHAGSHTRRAPSGSGSPEHSGSRLFSLQPNEAVYSPSWRQLESDK